MDRQTDMDTHEEPCTEAGGGGGTACLVKLRQLVRKLRQEFGEVSAVPSLGLTWPPAWVSRGEHRGGRHPCVALLCAATCLAWLFRKLAGMALGGRDRGAGPPEG